MLKKLIIAVLNSFYVVYGLGNTSFAIVIPSYNNAQWYQKNLDSVFAQRYDNYRIIYINDCSSDKTGDLVDEYIHSRYLADRATIIHNNQRLGAMANFYRAVHMCADREVVVVLDGDDWFAHRDVLARLDQAYSDPTVWITYGNYKSDPYRTCFGCDPIPSRVVNNPRMFPLYSTAPRTFYAGLFKRININDFLDDDGDFFKAACDIAIMFPLFEIAGAQHVQYIPDVLYIYNRYTAINDQKIRPEEQVRIEQKVRGLKRYLPIDPTFQVNRRIT